MTRLFFTVLGMLIGAAAGAVLALVLYRHEYANRLLSCPRVSQLTTSHCLGSSLTEQYLGIGAGIGAVAGLIAMAQSLRNL